MIEALAKSLQDSYSKVTGGVTDRLVTWLKTHVRTR